MNPRRSDPQLTHAPRRDEGFVLVAVLVALVVITLLATAVALVSERAVREARENVEAFEAEVAAVSTRDSVLFLLNTQRQTYGGLTIDQQVVWSAGGATADRADESELGGLPPRLPIGNEIRLDGTAYQGLGGVSFALQDDGGLFSPNWTFPLYRPGFFALVDVPVQEWPQLEAKRLDYQDPDHLLRLGGAETSEYAERDLPAPSNRTLATALEVRRVLGWRDALEDRTDAELMSLVTASRNVSVNINTAPTGVLQTLPGVDQAKAERMVAMRRSLPFMLTWQFFDTFDLPLDEMAPVGLLATGNGTLRLWHNASGGPIRVLHWTLTPIDEGGRPWRLDYEIVLPRDEVTTDIPAGPTASPLFAAPDATRG
ncbi:MAG: hypothetical protein ACREO4_15070 [Lysobacter sp.]